MSEKARINTPTTRLVSTSHGTNREAFTPADWALFLTLALLWGSSFLFIAIGLDAFHPGLVTMLRVALGASFLALIPRTRSVRIDREDRGKITPLQQKYGSLSLMARVQWIATLMVVPFGLVGLGQSTFAWPSLLAVAAIGVLGTGLAFVLMGTLAGSVGATRASFLTYLIPVVALLLGVIFRNELISPVSIVGVALVIAGAILASRRETPKMPAAAAISGNEPGRPA